MVKTRGIHSPILMKQHLLTAAAAAILSAGAFALLAWAEDAADATVTMEYDDRMDAEEFFDEVAADAGVSLDNYTVSVTCQDVTSWQVSAGKKTSKKDTAVIDIDGSGTTVSALCSSGAEIRAAGTGTATLELTSADGSDVIGVEVTVEPAELTIMFVAGQSNVAGWCSDSTGHQPEYSVACEDGTVYSTYVPTTNLIRSGSIAGVTFSTACTESNASSFVAGALTGDNAAFSISGSGLAYAVDALTEDGSGKTGMDSALAYEWNQLTGDKVWVVNAAWGGSSITTWVPGASNYERAEAVCDLALQTLSAEVSAGHFTEGDQLMFWLQGESNLAMDAETYYGYFSDMYDGFVSDFPSLDGIGIVMVRASTGEYDTDDELEMTGPRIVQYTMGNSTSFPLLYVVSNANEQWVSDSGVSSYFTGKYGSTIDASDYPIRKTASTPATMDEVHSDIHYSQIAHNENGITAADGMYGALYGTDATSSVGWYNHDGSAVTSYTGYSFTDNVLVPVASPAYTGKQVTINKSGVSNYNILLGMVPQGKTASGTLTASYGSGKTSSVSVSITGVSSSHTGFYEMGGTWYYLKNGTFDDTLTDVIKGTVNGTTGWWYVKNGVVSFTDTVAKNSNGWWRIENGMVNFNFTGYAENSNGWWYIEDGKVQFGVTSIIRGTVDDTTGWWYVVDGKVTFTTTVAKNSNGWWYVKNGMVDFTHYGVEKNSNGWWYLKGGKVQFGVTDVIKGTVNGTTGWWYVKNGMVDFTHYGVEKNSNGWWRIEAGKVNFDFNGFAENSNGWWYLEGGKVQFGVTGFISGTVDGQSGTWYVKNGQVMTNYTGSATAGGVTRSVVNGKAS